MQPKSTETLLGQSVLSSRYLAFFFERGISFFRSRCQELRLPYSPQSPWSAGCRPWRRGWETSWLACGHERINSRCPHLLAFQNPPFWDDFGDSKWNSSKIKWARLDAGGRFENGVPGLSLAWISSLHCTKCFLPFQPPSLLWHKPPPLPNHHVPNSYHQRLAGALSFVFSSLFTWEMLISSLKATTSLASREKTVVLCFS